MVYALQSSMKNPSGICSGIISLSRTSGRLVPAPSADWKSMAFIRWVSWQEPAFTSEILYKEFGIDAEILIDHAWGLEPCGMKEINAYRPETNSLSEGQVLSCPYSYDKVRIIVQEMTDSLVFQLTGKGLLTDNLTLDVGYDRENCNSGKYRSVPTLTTTAALF